MTKNKYSNGNVVKGCVTGIEDYGIFVSLDNYYSGLIHISEISDSYVRNISDYVNIGETINVEILDVNDNNFHVKLSIKNIDYRINKKSKTKIKEVGRGFEPLRERLDDWINEKTDEIMSKKMQKQ